MDYNDICQIIKELRVKKKLTAKELGRRAKITYFTYFFAETVNQTCGGRLEIKSYLAGKLVGALEIFEQPGWELLTDIYQRIAPFVGLQMIGLTLCFLFPDITTYFPGLMVK